MSFVDAAKIFKTTPKEEALKPLPEFHHNQVNKATTHFKNVVKTTENKKVTKAQLSAIEKRVLNVLPTYAAQVKDKFYKQILKRTIDEIYKGSHRKLPTNIDKAFKRYKKENINDLEVFVDRLYNDVLKEYKFSDTEQPNGVRTSDVKMFAKPQIVISESFA